jgi:hypothetical protein
MLYIIFELLHNLFDLSQVSLSKMAKYWNSFLSHYKCAWIPIRNVGICHIAPALPGHIYGWLTPELTSFPERKACITKHNYWSTSVRPVVGQTRGPAISDMWLHSLIFNTCALHLLTPLRELEIPASIWLA